MVDNFIEYSGWGNWWGTMIVNQYVARNASELLIHEIGHTFSLAHTFQSDNGQCAPNSDPDNQGDYISDTDPHLENDYCIYKSPTAINTCTELPFGNVLKILCHIAGVVLIGSPQSRLKECEMDWLPFVLNGLIQNFLQARFFHQSLILLHGVYQVRFH